MSGTQSIRENSRLKNEINSQLQKLKGRNKLIEKKPEPKENVINATPKNEETIINVTPKNEEKVINVIPKNEEKVINVTILPKNAEKIIPVAAPVTVIPAIIPSENIIPIETTIQPELVPNKELNLQRQNEISDMSKKFRENRASLLRKNLNERPKVNKADKSLLGISEKSTANENVCIEYFN